MALGQKVQKGEPIPAEWAIAWYTRLANNALPTAAVRCSNEFNTLFQLRYQQAFGEGIKLKPGKTKLKTSYFPSNPSFGRSLDINVGNLPDISRFTAKVTKIGEVVLQCRKELESLSRFLARNPDAHTAAAIALLPADLLPQYGGNVLKNLQSWLDQNFAQPKIQVAVVSGEDILKYWSGSNPEKLTKTEANGLANTLARLGYGIEPDPHLGGTLPTLKNNFALFRLTADSDNPDESELWSDGLSEEYIEAALLMQLAIAAASGNESPNPVEQQYLETHFASVVAVEEWERSRLNAHMHLLLHEKSNLRGLKARIAKLSPAQRQEFAQFIVQVAAADGQATPQEVQVLEKIYKQLELDPQTLYSDLHVVSTTTTSSQPAREPVTVRKATSTRGHKIPVQPKGKSKQQELALDMSLVESKLTESQEISNILADIFVDEEGSPKTPSTTKTHHTHTKTSQVRKSSKSKSAKSSKSSESDAKTVEIAGLDHAHSELLFALKKQERWKRGELEAIATQLDLMLDGALEVINEAAFDRCDEAVTEGDDPIEVNSDVLRELLA
jgi:uncharacterized tellurite resistance protein B-like protein